MRGRTLVTGAPVAGGDDVPRGLPGAGRNAPQQAAGQAAPGTVLAWDLPTRLFKWSLVLCVAAAWVTNRYAVAHPYLHVWNGIIVLVLLVFRLLWGVIGGSTARFAAFVTTPWSALRFLRRQVGGEAPPYLGHTPIAGQMILALLAVLAAQACTGLFSSDPDRLIVEGPLAATIGDAAVHRLSNLHRLGFQVLLLLVVLHVSANVAYAVLTRSGYIKAMVTGRKPKRAYCDLRQAEAGSLPLAVGCLAVSVLIVFGAIHLLGGALVAP